MSRTTICRGCLKVCASEIRCPRCRIAVYCTQKCIEDDKVDHAELCALKPPRIRSSATILPDAERRVTATPNDDVRVTSGGSSDVPSGGVDQKIVVPTNVCPECKAVFTGSSHKLRGVPYCRRMCRVAALARICGTDPPQPTTTTASAKETFPCGRCYTPCDVKNAHLHDSVAYCSQKCRDGSVISQEPVVERAIGSCFRCKSACYISKPFLIGYCSEACRKPPVVAHPIPVDRKHEPFVPGEIKYPFDPTRPFKKTLNARIKHDVDHVMSMIGETDPSVRKALEDSLYPVAKRMELAREAEKLSIIANLPYTGDSFFCKRHQQAFQPQRGCPKCRTDARLEAMDAFVNDIANPPKPEPIASASATMNMKF